MKLTIHFCLSGPDIPKSGTIKEGNVFWNGEGDLELPSLLFSPRGEPLHSLLGGLSAEAFSRRVWFQIPTGSARHLVLPLHSRTPSFSLPLVSLAVGGEGMIFIRAYWKLKIILQLSVQATHFTMYLAIGILVCWAALETSWRVMNDDKQGFGS